jgi:hypothetical protein
LFWDIPGSKPVWQSGVFSELKITANSTYWEAKVGVSGYVARSQGNEGLFWGGGFPGSGFLDAAGREMGVRGDLSTFSVGEQLFFGSHRTPYGCKKWRIPAHVLRILA